VAYQEALALRPSDNGALLGIANALVKERKFPNAETRFQKEAGYGKDGDARQEKVSAANYTGSPRADRQNDRIGDQIAVSTQVP
jgi:hypothetical protein